MRNSKYYLLLVLLLTIGYYSCAPKVATRDGVVRSDPNIILKTEFVNLGLTTASEVIRRLRPQWLRNRRGQTVAPAVYVNDIRKTFDILNILHLPDVIRIEFFDRFSAKDLVGISHRNGSIKVYTK